MSAAEIKALLAARLLPVADWTPPVRGTRSDYDLNPDLQLPQRRLTPAAVLVAVIDRPEGVSVILTRRADTLSRHTGQIALPGGRLDPGETAVQAALREAWEEVGLAPDAVQVLGLGDAYETGTGYLITPVVGWLAEPPTLSASPDEVAELFEAPWDFLMAAANHRRDFLDAESGPRRWFWAVTWGERYIWGVTAGVLRALSVRLYGERAEDAA